MEVLGYDPYISVEHAWKLSRAVRPVKQLDEIFEKCDYITVHIPLLDSTRGMFNADVFAKMKKGAALLNFSRGELVDNDALLAALESGQLRRYVTDFANDAILGAKNCVCLPHLGASTPESEDNCAVMAAEELTAYLETGAIRNSVNFPNAPLSADFAARTCVLHTEAAAEAVAAALGDVTFAGAKKGYGYTVADKAADEAALAAIDGVVRVRVLKK